MLSVAHWISFSNPPLTAERKSQDFLFCFMTYQAFGFKSGDDVRMAVRTSVLMRYVNLCVS